MEELFDIITGNVKDFVFKHDSVRVIQCAVKYATMEQKKDIAKELQGEYKALAESKYAKFLVAKLLVEDKDIREMIISEFYGHVKRLINHPEASWILDDTYRQVATSAQKAILLQEWYGPEFALFKQSDSANKDDKATADLVAILEDSPEKRKPIMSHLFALINQLVQKKLTGFTMLHDAMLQYSLAAGAPGETEAGASLLELLKPTEEGDEDLLKNLAFTASGSRLVCRTLAQTTAKDRKVILRVYKDSVELLAQDPNGMHVLLASYEVVDDTVLTTKLAFPSLVYGQLPAGEDRYNAVVELAHHPVGRIPLLFPFAGEARSLIQPKSDLATLLTEIHTLRSQTSKKDPEVRRQELAKALLTQSDCALLSTIANRAQQLSESSFGCQAIMEILLSSSTAADDLEAIKTAQLAAMTAVAELAAGDPNAENHIAKSPFGGRMLSTLAQGARWDPAAKSTDSTPKLAFAPVLWPHIKDHVVAWASGSSNFVILNLMQDANFDGRTEIAKQLKKQKTMLEGLAKTNKGAAMLLETL